ncbi:MAG: cysteine desulfurase [Clostridia bacterium]|nr:cysteine desulfurase [Clostridia bacterium]
MIYLDNAATTRPLKSALDDAERALNDLYFNPSALYAGGIQTHREIDGAREEILSLLADKENFDLIFTSCGTEADNQAIFGSVKRGNFVTTLGEHAAVYECARELKNRGIDVRFAPLNGDGSIDSDALLRLVDENTSLVSVIHVNNETGAINPIERISEKVKQKNGRTLVMCDGVQAFGKIPVRLTNHIDFYSVSAHKIGALKGTGALIKRKKINLAPYLYGGGQEKNHRSGTENVFGILAFASAAKKRLSSLKGDSERVLKLREKLFEMLDKDTFVRLSSISGTPYILTVVAKGVRGETLVRMLSDQGVFAGTGSACSSKKPYSRVIEACGLDKELLNGVLRFSFSAENTEEEIASAAKIINATAKELYGRVK